MKKPILKRIGEAMAAAMSVLAGRGTTAHQGEAANAGGYYEVECHDAQGNLKWRDTIKNVVTTVGGNFALDTVLNGSAYTAVWYLGLISLTSYVSVPVIADTMASHATWAEDQNYSTPAARGTVSFSTAASGKSKTAAAAVVYTMNATTTIKGCFLTTVSTKGGTTGTLYSAGLFTGGDKALNSGDTLSVTYTATI